VVVEPAETKGATFVVPDEATVGRGGGCQITVADTFASQLHARLFRTDGTLYVEDLGSTNGTFLNGARVGGPQAMRKGDRLKVGGTVLELR
jgi:pSer/pThr/pTyr-binding forkhead associated (FHA) protein